MANKKEKNCDGRIKLDDPISNMALQAISGTVSTVSGGDELVPHVTIDVPSIIEVPNNNSGPQLVPHVDANVTIVLEVANNHSFGQQDGNSDLKPGALFAIGDCATSIAAIVSNPPSRADPMYLMAVGIIFTAGMLGVLAALWVSRDARKRRTAKRTILLASIATFILGLVLNVYAYKVKNKK